MVKKLLKHEFMYYVRTFGLFLPIVLVIGVMARVFRLFDNGDTINDIMIFSSSAMLVISCAALVLMSNVVGIVRFYKNLFTAEGYLSFTLPVTNGEHIFVKLLASLVCQTVCFLVAVAAGAIALSGDLMESLWRDASAMMGIIWEGIGPGHCIGYCLEMVLLMVLSGVANMLLFYACITVGQTAKKNRIVMAVAAYFVYYVATQIFATVLTVVLAVLGMTEALNGIGEWVACHPLASFHIYLCGIAVFTAGLSALFWVVTQKIMTKKLNLE